MKTSVPSNWIIGMDKAEADAFIQILVNNTKLTNRIKDILKMTLQSLEDAEESEKNFLAPEYAFRHAYILGRKKELKKLLKLFDFRTKD